MERCICIRARLISIKFSPTNSFIAYCNVISQSICNQIVSVLPCVASSFIISFVCVCAHNVQVIYAMLLDSTSTTGTYGISFHFLICLTPSSLSSCYHPSHPSSLTSILPHCYHLPAPSPTRPHFVPFATF